MFHPTSINTKPLDPAIPDSPITTPGRREKNRGDLRQREHRVMAARVNSMVLLVLLTVAASLRSSAAATYVVGDALGWTIPPNPSSYSNWASTKTFVVGDILVFNFTSGRHDVTEVAKAAYDSCSGNNPISVETSSPARITLATAGDHHFICSFPGHCGGGQKLSVTVRGPSSPAPRASTPSPSAAPVSPSPLSPKRSNAPSPSPLSPKPSTLSPALTPSPRSSTPPKTSPPSATPPPENAASPSTNTAPSTPSPTTAPPPPNSANSLGVYSFFSTVLAIAIALIY